MQHQLLHSVTFQAVTPLDCAPAVVDCSCSQQAFLALVLHCDMHAGNDASMHTTGIDLRTGPLKVCALGRPGLQCLNTMSGYVGSWHCGDCESSLCISLALFRDLTA